MVVQAKSKSVPLVSFPYIHNCACTCARHSLILRPCVRYLGIVNCACAHIATRVCTVCKRAGKVREKSIVIHRDLATTYHRLLRVSTKRTGKLLFNKRCTLDQIMVQLWLLSPSLAPPLGTFLVSSRGKVGCVFSLLFSPTV